MAAHLQMPTTVIVLPIYAASEEPIPGVTAELLAERIQGPRVEFAPDFATAVSVVAAGGAGWRLILTLGAGSVSQLGSADSAALEASRTLISRFFSSLRQHLLLCQSLPVARICASY